MSRIKWHNGSYIAYEAGVEKVLLHVNGLKAAVPWNGVTKIEENYKGGDILPVYQDGFRTHNFPPKSEIEFSIAAYTKPSDFNLCEGMNEDSAAPGLIFDLQEPKGFNLSYVTRVGDSLSANSDHYKIHIVYNCLVAPSGKTNMTLSDRVNPSVLSWDIKVFPPRDFTHILPTPHLTIDSKKADPKRLTSLEDTLYGTDEVDGIIPTPTQVFDILSGVSR